jgi:hypothetical protein
MGPAFDAACNEMMTLTALRRSRRAHAVRATRVVPPSMTRTLFTLGYQKRDLQEFIDLIFRYRRR